ncbi:MAG TPA: hypothetical protein PKV52_03725, partial [Candidatus Saccharibacteria bacterium]|nr:hypothetical protein [Candidatus Saccharibacteria bacterium]
IPFFAKGTDSLPFDAQTIAKTSGIPHVVIYRKATGNTAPSGNPDVPDYNKTPKLAAQEHWTWHRSQLPPELDKAVTWVETINEVDKNRAEWLAEFAIETAKLTMADGYKWLAFGWSTGEPEPAHWQGVKMRQFLDMVAQNPDKLGIAVHEYSLDVNQINVPYLMGRYKNILDVNPNVNIYVTEWGWTYNAAPNMTKAMADITAIADVYNHPRLKGCAIWALNGGWGNIAQTVKTYITPLKELTLNTVLPDPSDSTFNYSFENGWTDVAPAPDRLQQPRDWQLTVLEPGEPIWGNNAVTGTPSIVTGIPECIHKHNNQLPPNQQFGGSDALILDGNYVYKIQAVHMVCGVKLSTTITGLSPNTNYNVTVPTQVHYQNDYPDPEPDDIEIWINDSHYLAEILPDREWLPLETIVTSNSSGSAVLDIRFMTKWGNSRDMFIDNITLYEVADPPPTTPGLGYKSIPVLLPQDATLSEIIDVRTAEFANRRTITQSHDEVIQLVKLGKAGSYAIIYDIHRWPVENQQQLLAIPHELRTLTPTAVKLTLPILYSQRNTAWASKCIGVCPNDKTIGNWGCLLTAYNMLAQYLGL